MSDKFTPYYLIRNKATDTDLSSHYTIEEAKENLAQMKEWVLNPEYYVIDYIGHRTVVYNIERFSEERFAKCKKVANEIWK